jgi:hypothetical protein
MGGIDLIQDSSGFTEVAVLRRQIDGSIRLKGLPMDTLKGAKERKQYEPVSPAEILLGVASDLFLETVDIRVCFPDEGGGAVNIHSFHPVLFLLERIRVVQLPPNPK